MTETKIVRQTIDNIFLKTARKLLPFYNSKLILSVKQCNSTTEQTIKTCVLPKLEEIINSTSSDDIFKQLEAVRSTAWLPGSTSQLCVSVDMELKKLCDTLKGLYGEIKSEVLELQKEQSKSDLTADVFTVVKRDMMGVALELQHRAPQNIQEEEEEEPQREYIFFKHQMAIRLEVLKTLKYLLGKDGSFPNSTYVPDLTNTLCTNLQGLISPLFVAPRLIKCWLQDLAKQYSSIIGNKYNLHLRDLIDYMIDKEERNENSHFKDKIKQYAQKQQQQHPRFSFNDFITTETSLLSVLSAKIPSLQLTFQKLWTNDEVTVTDKNGTEPEYKAYFILETDPYYEWHLANLVTIRDENQNEKEIPRYWKPSIIDRRRYHFKHGHS